MGFWIFMMAVNLLVPLTMIIGGLLLSKKPPKKVNAIYGYRTDMSMKNDETFEFANRHCGKLWVKLGLIILIPVAVVMLFVIGEGTRVIGIVAGISCSVQLAILIGSIFPTEIALRKKFDKEGNKIM